VSGAAVFGETPIDGCDPKGMMCERVSEVSEIGFVYGRVGGSLALGGAGQTFLALDVGIWRGIHREREDGMVTERRVFTIPMAGIAFLFAF
jgi:hypothetical protein